MKTLITIIFTIIFISPCFAQKDLLPAYPKEISFRGDIAYFNGLPFTGILVDEKTNKKIGEFSNGYRNGKFIEYYPNGKKKIEGKYTNGVKEGLHAEWFENGNKKNECKYVNGKRDGTFTELFENKKQKSVYIYKDGEIVDGNYTTYIDNGQKEKEETYKGGQKIREGIYKDGQFYELSTIFFPGGNTKKSEGYLKDSKRVGQWLEWYENGQVNSKGNYVDGKEDGIWTWWYNNGDKKKEVKYEVGNLTLLIFENNVDPSFSIKARMKPNSYLFRTLYGLEEDTVFVMVSLNFDHEKKYKQLAENIIGAISLRLEKVNEWQISMYGKKMMGYNIEFTNPNVYAVYDDGVSNTNLGILNLQTKTSPGYRGKASVIMKINNFKNNSILFDNILENQSDKYKTQNDAFSIAPVMIRQRIIDQVYHIFKIKTTIKEIIEADGDGNAETVKIMCGKNLSLGDGFLFDIYLENEFNTKLGEIEVDEVGNYESECDVNEGEEVITKNIRSGKKLYAISKY